MAFSRLNIRDGTFMVLCEFLFRLFLLLVANYSDGRFILNLTREDVLVLILKFNFVIRFALIIFNRQ